jgi:archaellum biogenesis ATPase FlaH
MQIYSQELELKCIKTLTGHRIPEAIRSTLLGKLTREFFHYPPTIAAFNRINVIARKRFILVDFVDLVNDPALAQDFRDTLHDSDAEVCHSKQSIKTMLESLDRYRKMRILNASATAILDRMESDDAVNVDKLLDDAATSIAHARKDLEAADEFVIIGENGNAEDLMHSILHKVADELIKTGFNKYDSINGGVPMEGVMLLASTTSGGKSALLMNLMKNMYAQEHKRVCRVSLEMGDKQEMTRLLACISGISFSRIKQNKLNPNEKQRIKLAFEKFNDIGKKNKCVFNTVSPTKGMTIDDTLRMVKPYRYDVIGIDYISLLEEANGQDQWKVLSSIIRDCKVFSRENGCLIIVLCQLDDESDRLRYSKGMKEHADIMWSWNYSKKEQRDLRIIPISTNKARDAELLNFDLAERFDVMQINNIAEDAYSAQGADDTDEEADVEEQEAQRSDDYALS